MTLRYSFATVVAFLILTTPFLIFAQGGIPDRLVPCDGPDCTICHGAQLMQNIMSFLIGVGVFVATGMFAYAGGKFIYAGTVGDGNGLAIAKKLFVQVGWGLVLVLGAYLLVDTIMRVLTGAQFGPWNNICPAA